MIDDLLKDADRRMDKSVEAAAHEFTTVRTGRASAGLLDRIEIGIRCRSPEIKRASYARGMHTATRLDSGHHTAIYGNQPPADVEGGGRQDAAMFDEGQLGCPATDIDVENAGAAFVRYQRRSRAIRGQHGFHVMTGGRTHQVTGTLGDHRGDPLRVATP